MGLLKKYLHWYIPFLWRGGGLMHFVMYAFSNHAVVLHNVTPIDFDIRTVSNEHNI